MATRRDVLRAAPLLVSSIGQAARRPNVILIMTDDQGYGDLSCHGNPVIRTPNLDRLHSESVRCTNFHVDPLCAPTRAALMTGRYSARTGVWATIMGRSLLRRDETTMANVFANSGYRTGIFGKWHLGDNYPYRPQDRGFEESLVHRGGGVGQTPDHWGNSYFDDTFFRNGKPEKGSGYCTDVFFRAASEFIDANRERPFFLYLTPNAPHWPYNVADSYRQPYAAKGLSADMASFYGMIANFDENVGRLMTQLKQRGLEDDTILMFMTDNGTAAGFGRTGNQAFQGFNAGMRATKGAAFDGGHRVPLFVRWPAGGIRGGRDSSQLAAHIDLLPTLIELAGLKKPDAAFDGMSLAPWLRRDTAAKDRSLIVQVQQRQEDGKWQMDNPQPWQRSAVLTQRWRLVDGKSLYDVQADPGQSVEVANPEVVAQLRGRYQRWWDSVSQRFGEYNRIVIGHERENPAELNCMDWHGEIVPWDQTMIRKLPEANGFWAIEVDRAGEYEFTLRHQPDQEPLPLRADLAQLRVGQAEKSAAVGSGQTSATLRVKLDKGPAEFRTLLREPSGKSRGAFYVDVRRSA